jgi:hypothetical protein
MIAIGPRSVNNGPIRREYDSLPPDAGAHGYTLSADAPRSISVSPERRRLTPRAILAWTVSSLLGALLFATALAIVLSRRDAAADHTEASQKARGDAVPGVAQVPSTRSDIPPSDRSASVPPPLPVIPLSALPLVAGEPGSAAPTAKQQHRVALHSARASASRGAARRLTSPTAKKGATSPPAKKSAPHQSLASPAR